MWPLATYSDCFEIVSTVAFLVSQKQTYLGKFVFTLYIMIIQGIIFAVPGYRILEYQLVHNLAI